MSVPNVMGYAVSAVQSNLSHLLIRHRVGGTRMCELTITHCGVCHTDIHAIDDYYGITTYPFRARPRDRWVCVGRGSPRIRPEGRGPGRHRLARSLMWACEWCLQGQEQLCQDIVRSATWEPYGGFLDLCRGRLPLRLPAAGLPCPPRSPRC